MATPTALLQVVIPTELNNYVYNPSAEAPGNFTAVGAPTITRSTTQSRQVAARATYSYKVVTTSSGQGIQLTTAALPSASIYMSGWIYVESGSPAFSFKCGSTSITPTLYETDGTWKWWVLDTTPWTSGQAGSQTAVQVIDTVGSSTWYLDDVTVSSALCRSFHGDYPGCKWNGTGIAHESTSLCFAWLDDGTPNTKAGGQIYDLHDTWLVVSQLNGAGYPTINNLTRPTIDGPVFQSSRLGNREMVLSGTVIGTSIVNLHNRRATLLDYIRAGVVFVLRWRGNTTYRGGANDVQEIECVYAKGLEGKLDRLFETVNIGLTAYDPHFMPATQSPTAMTLPTNVTLVRAIARTRDGGWGNFSSGPSTDIYALAISPRGHVIAGGASAVYGWNWALNTWSTLGAITGGAAECYALAFDPAGLAVYCAGSGTSWGGTSANHIAKYTLPTSGGITSGTWASLGTGAGGAGALIRACVVAANGDVYVGGDFTTLNAAAVAANYVGRWNVSSSTWTSLGPNTISGTSTAVHALAVTAKSVFVGGVFDTIGTVSAPGGFSVSNTTGSLSSGNWGYCVTSLTGDGESAATSLTTSGTSATGKSLSWTAVTGATGYNIYREAAAGGGAAQVYYLTTVTTNSFTDTGQFTLNTAIEEPSTGTSGGQTKRVARYDISGNYFAGVGVSGMADGIVRGLGVAQDGTTLYAVGTFTSADGATCTRAAVSNGQDWRPLGDGLDSDGYCALVDRVSGEVVIGGSFTASGVGSLARRLAFYHPGTATGKLIHADLMLGGGTVRALAFDHNGELWVAGTFNHTSLTTAQTAVIVVGEGGGFLSYPSFYVTGPGTLRYIENATTNQKIWLNLPVVDSEIVTIQLKRGGVAITSTRLNGEYRWDAFVDGDVGELGLVQGTNRVRILYHDSSTGLQPSGNAAVKIVDPAMMLSADA